LFELAGAGELSEIGHEIFYRLTWLLCTLVKQISFVRDVCFPDAVAIECLDYFRYVTPVSLVLKFKRTENTVRCGAYARQKHCETLFSATLSRLVIIL